MLSTLHTPGPEKIKNRKTKQNRIAGSPPFEIGKKPRGACARIGKRHLSGQDEICVSGPDTGANSGESVSQPCVYREPYLR